MYLNYSKLKFNIDGIPETPELVLKTMHEETIGVISGAHNIKLKVKFAEPSEIEFDVPAVIAGERNPIYDEVVGYRIVYTETYGVYVILNPSTEQDGISDVKHVTGFSLEKTLDTKKFFLEGDETECTLKFYNVLDKTDPDTLIGRVLEVAEGWTVGYIDPAVAQRYRTFSGYDDYLLSFLYGDCHEKYRCVFVFDPYKKTISVYDADSSLQTIPIYLDFDNLLSHLEVNEITDELVTAIRPYGSDDLDIREVNPVGSNWIYDLSYFVENGDIPQDIAEKYIAWQKSILNNQAYYKGLIALRASATSSILAAEAALVDLKGELDSLTAQQSITIQTIAIETAEGKKAQEELLQEINQRIAAKEAQIEKKEAEIEEFKANEASYAEQIAAVVNELALAKYFTADERAVLLRYMIEQDVTEDTFVATDLDTSVSGASYELSGETVAIESAKITKVDLTEKFQKVMFVISGGTFAFSGEQSVSGDVIRGTLEVNSENRYVLSIYAGSILAGETSASSGNLTLAGDLSDLAADVVSVTEDGVTTLEGTSLSFVCSDGSMFLTANISEYQKYSVQLELYDYALSVLADLATPTYEFSVDSGNFIFAEEFAPFRNELELGKGIFLNIDGKRVITPYIIEFELDFEKHDYFELVFSNRFKRHDYVNTLKDMVEKSYSSSRSFDSGKYIYNRAADQAALVSKFMRDSLNAAVNTIIGAANQSVIINASGIHVSSTVGDKDCQLRIVNGMIAMSDDNWNTAKLAIGYFNSEDVGPYYGVNAEVIGGKLIVGNNLVIENETDDGVMQFKVDSSGAWLSNSTMVLQKDGGGKILIDPKYGIVAGTGSVYTLNGTTVSPSFLDEDGKLSLDEDGMPENTNFYLDIQNGDAYFRGTLNALSGSIGGFEIAEDYLHTGSLSSFVALNGSGDNEYSAYALWAGAENPANAKFWVKKDGSIHAKDGTFSGVLSAARVSGALDCKDGELIGPSISVPNAESPNFYVDSDGNVTMKGNINLSAGSISWGSNSPVKYQFAASASGPWHDTMVSSDKYRRDSTDGGVSWGEAYQFRGTDGSDADVPGYIKSTYIDATQVASFYIKGNKIEAEIPKAASANNDQDVGFILTGSYLSGTLRYLRIWSYEGDSPMTVFDSPQSCHAWWDFPNTYINGKATFRKNVEFTSGTSVSFKGVNVSGLDSVAVFG